MKLDMYRASFKKSKVYCKIMLDENRSFVENFLLFKQCEDYLKTNNFSFFVKKKGNVLAFIYCRDQLHNSSL